jgi:hypothetical protein
MQTESPLRGAAPVNNELEVGYDAPFEGRWRYIEKASHIFMALFVLCSLSGLLGRGPLSHRTLETEDGRLAADFEPISRYGTTTQLTLHLSTSGSINASSPGDASAMPVRVFLGSALVEPLGLQQVIPRPASSEAVDGGLVYTFNIPPGKDSALVRFVLKPAVVGPVHLESRQGSETLSWIQWVLP